MLGPGWAGGLCGGGQAGHRGPGWPGEDLAGGPVEPGGAVGSGSLGGKSESRVGRCPWTWKSLELRRCKMELPGLKSICEAVP